MKKMLLILLLSLFAACNESETGTPASKPEIITTDATVVTYRYADEASASSKFEVKVNGKSQFVLHTDEPDICCFGCSDSVYVQIFPAVGVRIRGVAVRPVNKHFPVSWTAESAIVKMTAEDRVVVEFDRTDGSYGEEKPLFLFANPIEAVRPDRSDPSVRYFEAGRIYDAGTIRLESNQSVYIEGGAIVNGKVLSENASNVAVRGCGILCDMEPSGAAVRFNNCHNIILRDLTVLNKNSWTTYFCMGDGASITNYKAVAVSSDKADGSGNENDACDFLGFSNARCRKGFSYCHDDAICVKSQKFSFGAHSSDIHYDDYVLWNNGSGNGMEIGYELNMGVSDISYRNCYVIHSAGRAQMRRGALSIHNATAGTVSDISYENIFIEDAKEFGIHMAILKSSYDIGKDVVWGPGYIRNVTFKNIHIDNIPPYGCYINGYDSSHKIEGVVFDGLYFKGKKIMSADDFGMVKFADVTFR